MARNEVTVVQKLGSSLAFMEALPDTTDTTRALPFELSTRVDTFYTVVKLRTRVTVEIISRSYLPVTSSRTSMSMATKITVTRRNSDAGILTS